MTFHVYEPFINCTGKAQPGTKNLAAAVDALWSQANVGGAYGIYNCRPPSLHGEGRALDIGFPGSAHPQGTQLVRVMVHNAWDLGLMGIIWNRTRWSRRYPNGTPYTGASPHLDHIHVEQTRRAASTLTLSDAKRLLGDPMALTEAEEQFVREMYASAQGVGTNGSFIEVVVKLIRAIRGAV